MELSEGEFSRLSGRVESIYSAIISVQRDIAVAIADQRRNDRELSELRAAISLDAEKCVTRIDSVASGVSRLNGDRRFFLGICSAVSLIFAALQGVAVKLATSYADEIDHRFKEVEARAKQHREQSMFDLSKHDAEIQTLKDKLRDGTILRPASTK